MIQWLANDQFEDLQPEIFALAWKDNNDTIVEYYNNKLFEKAIMQIKNK